MQKQKTSIIPLDNIPPPWRDIIKNLQNKVVVLPSEPSEDEQMNLWRVGIILDIALHWVVKNELHTKHRIPYRRNLTKVLKPLGLLITCYLRLCSKAYEKSEPGTLTLKYQNAAEWFEGIYEEIWVNALDHSQYGNGKTRKLKERRNTLNALREDRNPVDQNTSPHEYLLIRDCLRLRDCLHGDELDVFEENYWKPYLRAYSAWITASDKPEMLSVRMENGELRIQQGRGRGRVKIPIRTDFLERLPSKDFSL